MVVFWDCNDISNIAQAIIFFQIMVYMEDNRLFYNDQFWFRPGHFSELASVQFVDKLV